jgi:alpha-ribazole phosphatase
MKISRITTIDLLRHGACEGGEIFRGSTDVPLTETGWQQMREALVDEGGWQRVFTSPLQRCRLFSEQLAQTRALPLAVIEDLRELHFGDWEGRRITDIEREESATLQSFWRDPMQITPPNGESMADCRARVLAAAEHIINHCVGEHVLIVAHGAVIRLLLGEWLQMSMTAFSNIAVPYAGFSRIRIYYREGFEPWVQLCLLRGE